MPRPQSKDNSVTWDQVAAFRLTRHHLVEKASPQKLLSVVDDMTGAQAQLLSAAQSSFRSRIRGLELKHIEEAFRKRTMVKAAGMRRTLFLFPSDQVGIFVSGSARRALREYRWARGKGVSERLLDTAIEAVLGVLNEPLTRPEIADRTSRALGVQMRFAKGGGWGSQRELASVPVGHLTYPVVDLLHLAGTRGIVCYGPSQGIEPTFVRADAWIPNWIDILPEEAEVLLFRKYLRAYGPATVADFALWAGLTSREAHNIWAREQSGLATVNVDGWIGSVLREDVGRLLRSKVESPVVRLLPYFDTFLLGHRQRIHLVAKEHYGNIYRPQGWISPVVLVDGRVAAVWGHTVERDHLHVKVEKLGPLNQKILAGIQEETQDLARFLDVSDFDVKIH